MALFWQSSEFWILVCTLLLVLVGCTILRNPLSQSENDNRYSPSPLPSLISTYSPPDLMPSGFDFSIVTWTSDQIYERSTSPPPNNQVIVENSSCYAIANGDYSCLGKIWNYTNETIGDNSIEVSIFDAEDAKFRSNVATEQRIIQSGTFAPYRALIDSRNFDLNLNTTFISTALLQSFEPSQNIAALTITESHGHITETGRYNLSVTIHNDSGFVAQDIRLFTTLDNTEWGIVGYSVYEVGDSLENDAEQSVELDIIPLAIPDAIEHILHVEAFIAE